MTICPFCGRDPFHYVDNGVGMEAVAVSCCELGDQYFRGMRPAPEEVTLSWDEFNDIGNDLTRLRRIAEAAESLAGYIRASVNVGPYTRSPGKEGRYWRDLHEALRAGRFSEVAQHYKLIDSDTMPVLVPYDLAIFNELKVQLDAGLQPRLPGAEERRRTTRVREAHEPQPRVVRSAEALEPPALGRRLHGSPPDRAAGADRRLHGQLKHGGAIYLRAMRRPRHTPPNPIGFV